MIAGTELRKPVVRGTQAYVDEQIEKIHKRIERLSPRAYDLRPKRFKRSLEACLATLGLDAVHTLPRPSSNVLKSDQDQADKHG